MTLKHALTWRPGDEGSLIAGATLPDGGDAWFRISPYTPGEFYIECGGDVARGYVFADGLDDAKEAAEALFRDRWDIAMVRSKVVPTQKPNFFNFVKALFS